MRRRRFLYGAGGLAGLTIQRGGFGSFSLADAKKHGDRIIGMYVHQHWPYNHPYAARFAWTLDDYRGYADGLKKLGYNMVMIWPILETMPNPLTPIDRANLDKIARVIDMLHDEFQMKTYIALCPNVGAKNEEAAKYEFQKRHFFYCDMLVDPGDPAALTRMIKWRESFFRWRRWMDY